MRSHYRPAGVQLLSGLGWSALQEINRASDCLKATAPWSTHLTLTAAASTRKRRLFYFLTTCRDQCGYQTALWRPKPKVLFFFIPDPLIPVCAHSQEGVSKNSLPDGSLNMDGTGSCAIQGQVLLLSYDTSHLFEYLLNRSGLDCRGPSVLTVHKAKSSGPALMRWFVASKTNVWRNTRGQQHGRCPPGVLIWPELVKNNKFKTSIFCILMLFLCRCSSPTWCRSKS